MIPISITIKGLYSYQEEQVVEFDKLLEGQLFGIFGSVGSGKSSILEAIAFALYGETERMNRTDNRSYNMMNLKSGELWIDFQFKNYDESVYRFTVRGKRHGKDFTKVGTFERKAYKLVDDGWLPVELKSAEEVIGLSYVNFRRTIIIPQGKFQEFLQLGDKSRTDMLKEIFDLSKFEFFLQTASLDRKNKDAVQHLQGQLKHFEAIDKASLDEKEEGLKRLQEFLTAQQEEIAKKREEYQKLSALKKQIDQQGAIQDELEKLLIRESEIFAIENRVREYEYCLIHFKDKLNRKADLESAIKQETDRYQCTQQQIQENTQALEQARQELEQVQAEYLRQDEYKDQVADYETILHLHSLEKEQVKLKERIEKGQEHVKNTSVVCDEKRGELQVTKDKKKERQAMLPDMVDLANLRAWYDLRGVIEQRISKVSENLNGEESELEVILSKIKAQLSDPLLAGVGEATEPDFHLDAMRALKNQVLETQKLVQSQIDHHRLQTKLDEFASQLKSGEPCMLCGSTSHPHIVLIDDVEQQLKEEETTLSNLKQDESKLNVYLADLSHFIQALQRQKRVVQALGDEQKKEHVSLQEHLGQFSWSGFPADKPEQLVAAFKEAKELQEQIKADEKLERLYEEELEKLRKNLQTYEGAVNQFVQDNLKKATEHETLKKGLKRLIAADYQGIEDVQLKETIGALTQQIASVKSRYEGCVEKRDKAVGELIGLKERSEGLLRSLEDYQGKIARLQEELKLALDTSSFTELETVTKVLNQSLNVEALKNDALSYRQKVYSVRQQSEKIAEALEGHIFDKDRFIWLEEKLADAQTVFEEKKTQYIKEQDAFEKEQTGFNKKKELLLEMEQLLKRESNLDILKKLFKGSGFVNYISSVYLQNLCHDANRRFYKLTNQQLQLEVDANNNFQVRDFLNNGKVRSVKTLSGGQTFQASLSLALALAESVQQQNKSKQNFFFLDEGFGSLDRESLQTALATLKTLRKENRMVGVISHVEELQQEIDVYLKVRNDSVRGSLISGSWQQTY